MKRPIIEQKAKAYDMAIEELGVILNLNIVKESGTISVDNLIRIFPELKESEDEKIRQFLIHEVTETSDKIMSYRNMNKKDVLAWLEKQGEQKPAEWSEEDESRMDNLCHFLDEYGDQYYGHLTLQGTISWLKSIKERAQSQNLWKPSEEQMKALHDINLTGNISYAGQSQTLIELYNNLKKLTE